MTSGGTSVQPFRYRATIKWDTHVEVREGWYPHPPEVNMTDDLAELKQMADRLLWRPMETAPKDMRPILVFVMASRTPFQEEPDTIHIAFLKRPGVYALQDSDHDLVDPAFWMPLPESPFFDAQRGLR